MHKKYKAMATVTLEYDARNKVFEKLIDVMVDLGAKRKTVSTTKRKSPIDESIEDIKAGRVTTHKSSNDLFKKFE